MRQLCYFVLRKSAPIDSMRPIENKSMQRAYKGANKIMSQALDQDTAGSVSLKTMANAIRALTIDAVQNAKSGHPGMPLGMADVTTVLFAKFLKFDAHNLHWPDRDRFILSAGHGSMLQYAIAFLTGNEHVSLADIKNFRQLGYTTPGHPEYGHTKGVETTTGPLGQGLANGVGFALAERMLNARFGDDIVDHKTYVVVGDGCLMEGISQEAISMAGHWGLSKLVVLWDDNAISIDGSISLASSEDQKQRFIAANWDVFSCDGHDFTDIERALGLAQRSEKPVLITCKTIIGKGSPNKAGLAACHGAPLGQEEVRKTKSAIGWHHEAFVIPQEVLSAWRAVGRRGKQYRKKWEQRLDKSPEKAHFMEMLQKTVRHNFLQKIELIKRSRAINTVSEANPEKTPFISTRKASQMVLEAIFPHIPQLIGGSADLTGSNLTHIKGMSAIQAGNFSGNYIHYGVREHGMAAVMNGIALHGGFIPYGGTFLVFSDYCRPAIRLSALMGIRTIYVMTHDSIGLGEDGPTHQPIEHLAALRAIVNLNVFRPADLVETAECWALSLQCETTPSIHALSRQHLPTVRAEYTKDNLSSKGGYVCRRAQGKNRATIIATGSEVSLAIEAHLELQRQGIGTAVVSMPCLDIFQQQSRHYKQEILGSQIRVIVEAGIRMGWESILREEDVFIGMKRFGASAPADKLFEYFAITVATIIKAVQDHIGNAS